MAGRFRSFGEPRLGGRYGIEGCGSALDLALVEGFAGVEAERHEWDAPRSEFLPWRADTRDWLGTALCSFWWD